MILLAVDLGTGVDCFQFLSLDFRTENPKIHLFSNAPITVPVRRVI